MYTDDIAFDQRHIWHLYTSITKPLKIYPVIYTKGYELILNDGRHLIDGMSSWWSAIHGYNHPIINQAMKDQIDLRSHVMFGVITYLPAIYLCRRLIKLAPIDLDCVF